MAFKFVLSLTILSVVSAGVVDIGYNSHYYQQPAAYHQPTAYVQPATAILKQPAFVKQVVHEEPANYEFNYEVHDTHTGDIKRQHEKAENGQVSGQYSLVDPDGFRRVVSYTADAHHGFQANVQREPVDHKIIAPAHGWQAKPAHGWEAKPAHGWQAPTVTKIITPAPSHGWEAKPEWKPAPSHGWQAPTVTKVIAPAPSHGWEAKPEWKPAPAHGWQQAPTVIKVQAPSHGWQSNPWA